MAEAHRPFALVLAQRADEEALRDRDVRGRECGGQAMAPGPIIKGAPCKRHDVPQGDGFGGQQPPAVNRPVPDGGLG